MDSFDLDYSHFDELYDNFQLMHSNMKEDIVNEDKIKCDAPYCNGYMVQESKFIFICTTCNKVIRKQIILNTDKLETVRTFKSSIKSKLNSHIGFKKNTRLRRFINNGEAWSNKEKNVINYRDTFSKLYGYILNQQIIIGCEDYINFMCENYPGNFKVKNINILCRAFIEFMLLKFRIYSIDKYLVNEHLLKLSKAEEKVFSKASNFFENVHNHLSQNHRTKYAEFIKYFKEKTGFNISIEDQLYSLCEKYCRKFNCQDKVDEVHMLLMEKNIKIIKSNFKNIRYTLIGIIQLSLEIDISKMHNITKSTLINHR